MGSLDLPQVDCICAEGARDACKVSKSKQQSSKMSDETWKWPTAKFYSSTNIPALSNTDVMRMEEAITKKVSVYIPILLINSTKKAWKTAHVDVNNRSVDRAISKARNLLHNNTLQ